MGTVVAIGALLLVGIAITYIRQAMTRGLNKHVFDRRGNREGQQITKTDLLIHSTAPAQALWPHIASKVTTRPEPHAAVGDLYEVSRGEDRILSRFGNKLKDSFTALVHTTANGGGTDVLVQISKWTVSDGVVANINRMQRLREEVLAAVRAADPSATAQEIDSP
ncbi:hypothetical protein [Acidipropionibacterium virtanenii]|uniref:Uncharacterized protein n=1 Tax=Acidipropionibacterium virtanenii TaxID=2057246 RepID=A0A344UXE4_9ACTN|nr:hypothetical protein [Acidipropionibacterium virtanenii]AXE39942.1 hypothetical protein JS278_02807 [Acidipropionibacterium virtanenii]